MSKEVIRKLAERFKVSHEAFNRVYKLESANDIPLKKKTVRLKKRKVVMLEN